MLTLSQTTTTGVSLCAATAFLLVYQHEKHKKRLPPGPRKLPVVGNLFDMPKDAEWETFARWSKTYDSDILHVDVLGTSIIILNSYKVAEDLLDKRSGIYSSRPHLTMLHELSGFGYGFAMLPYGETWRASRRLFNKHMDPKNPKFNHPREIRYVRQFLLKLLDEPETFMKHIRHTVGANALSSIYGIPVRPQDDENLRGAEKVIHVGGELLVPGGFLVDAFPILKHLPPWFPGTHFHAVAARMKAVIPLIREVPFAASEETRRQGKYEPCLIMNGLEEIESSVNSSTKDVELLKDVAAQAFVAAADTTVSTTGTLFLAMTMYPEVQKKAQAELDEVLGGRLPDHGDLKNLPYLEAVIREVYRWHPVLPQAVPHVLVGDDFYRGYFIPSSSIVIPNLWAMLHDEHVYPEPHIFRPERYLKDGKIDPSIRNTADIAFGFGRRSCPGQHLAHSMFKITAASVLSCFDLLRKLDENGNEIQPKEEYHLAAQCQPLPFPCVIRPRSWEARSLVEAFRTNFLDD